MKKQILRTLEKKFKCGKIPFEENIIENFSEIPLATNLSRCFFSE